MHVCSGAIACNEVSALMASAGHQDCGQRVQAQGEAASGGGGGDAQDGGRVCGRLGGGCTLRCRGHGVKPSCRQWLMRHMHSAPPAAGTQRPGQRGGYSRRWRAHAQRPCGPGRCSGRWQARPPRMRLPHQPCQLRSSCFLPCRMHQRRPGASPGAPAPAACSACQCRGSCGAQQAAAGGLRGWQGPPLTPGRDMRREHQSAAER